MNLFPEELVEKILSESKKVIEQTPGPHYAAFDADGTLWSFDLGEEFFDYQIKSKKLSNLPPDPWQHYENLKQTQGHPAAYLWLAQINKGQKLDQVRRWSSENVNQLSPLPIFPSQKTVIEQFQNWGVEVFIVTASIAWAIEPAAPLLGVASEKVIGIRTQVKNGVITEDLEGVITYREGKVKGLLEKTQGRPPFFVAGNTFGDLALLQSATHLRLALASAPPGERNHETEQELQALAIKENWFRHSFL